MALSAGNRTLLRAGGEQELLEEMCRAVVEVAGYRMAWVGYAQHDAEKTIRPMAYAGFESGFLQRPGATWDESTERGRGASGNAIRTGKPFIVRDVQTDPYFAPWREAATKRGYASVLGLPLRIDGEVGGALVIYAQEPDAFDQAELELLSEMADDLAYGISALRTRIRQREAEEKIRRMAFYNPLTGLPNRLMLRQRLEQAIADAKRNNRSFPLLVLDLDRFREINEALGYVQADKLLQEIGPRLAKALAEQEFLAYIGEDAFAVLLPGGDAEHGADAARRILKALDQPFEAAGLLIDVRASIGIALFPGHGADPDSLILRADAAMYQAKHSSSGYAVHPGGKSREHARRLALVGELHRAIQDNELLLYCQPKAHIRTGTLCGAEALVRWRHPRHGMMALTEVIQIAEQTGLIRPLTYWVIGSALRQCHAWCEAGCEIPLAVNVSARNLREPLFVDRVKGLLSTWGTDPGLLQIEVTESALMEDPAGALETLTRLHAMGIEIGIDDFGTGYSSLSYLKRLPVDTLKVDQSFVRDIAVDANSATIVQSTIDLAHDLSLKVVGEGVENREIWDRLAALGCDMAQGHYLTEPLPAEEFTEWQRRSPWRLGRYETGSSGRASG
ncbi:MAG: EAL domain-containing protein [Betaproteobacteria bacterium]|nr:EAL domain-containing protein [Betaproteobacteria bacterium]